MFVACLYFIDAPDNKTWDQTQKKSLELEDVFQFHEGDFDLHGLKGRDTFNISSERPTHPNFVDMFMNPPETLCHVKLAETKSERLLSEASQGEGKFSDQEPCILRLLGDA